MNIFPIIHICFRHHLFPWTQITSPLVSPSLYPSSPKAINPKERGCISQWMPKVISCITLFFFTIFAPILIVSQIKHCLSTWSSHTSYLPDSHYFMWPPQAHLVYLRRHTWHTSAGTPGLPPQAHLVYLRWYTWYTTLTVQPSASASPVISVANPGSQLHTSRRIHSNIFWVFISLYTWRSVSLLTHISPILLWYEDLSKIQVSISLFLLDPRSSCTNIQEWFF